jgi:hypothetical protein
LVIVLIISVSFDGGGERVMRLVGPGNREGQSGAGKGDKGADLHGLSPSVSPEMAHAELEKSTKNTKKLCTTLT